MWEIKEEKTTAVVYITSFSGALIGIQLGVGGWGGGGGGGVANGALIQKSTCYQGANSNFYGKQEIFPRRRLKQVIQFPESFQLIPLPVPVQQHVRSVVQQDISFYGLSLSRTSNLNRNNSQAYSSLVGPSDIIPSTVAEACY